LKNVTDISNHQTIYSSVLDSRNAINTVRNIVNDYVSKDHGQFLRNRSV